VTASADRVVRVPRLTEGDSLLRQLPRLRSTSLSRKVTALAAGGAFCLAATGTAAAVSWGPSPAPPVQVALTRSLASSPSPSASPAPAPRQIAGQMLVQYDWDPGQFSCLDALWTHESGWNVYARNPNSGAYGIPQALPGDKMASAGPDWPANATTQIRWGLTYIQGRYGSPCAAWTHEQRTGWY
jgi:resuscitation-promoting factor RpfB